MLPLADTDKIPAAIAAWDDALLLPGVRSRNRLPAQPKSVIVRAFGYAVGDFPRRNLSLYAMLPDYHEVVLSLLQKDCDALQEKFPGHCFVPFCDASPIDEVQAAVCAGLGSLGKNGLLLQKDYGSLCFLGEIVTDLALSPGKAEPPCCGCGACIAACPTGALTAQGLDKTRCLSHLTQKKGALTEEETALIRSGALVWGCDRCTLACPLNRHAKKTSIEAFLRDVKPVLTPDNLDRMMKNRAFAWRGRAVLERNLAILTAENTQNQEADPCSTKF